MIRMRSQIVLFLFLFQATVYGQDTLFLRSLPIKGTVHNVTSEGQNLYLRIGDSIYHYENEKMELIEEGHLRFSWIIKDPSRNQSYWSHNQYILDQKYVPKKSIENLLPGPYNSFITAERVKDLLYVCYNGRVLEYRINDLVHLAYKGMSVRNVYSNDGLRIVSTYSGVFGGQFESFFDFPENRLEGYSSGEFVKIRSQYFLCRDNLLLYDQINNRFDSFLNFDPNLEIRQLIDFNNTVFAVFTNGLYAIDLENKVLTKQFIDDQITRAIGIGSELFVLSQSGIIYKMSEQLEIELIAANVPLQDLEEIDGTIYLGGERGLYKLKDTEVELISNIEVIEMINFNGYLIFSNNSGLYAYINSQALPIVESVEFNKYGLSYDNALFYAGSIKGLYYNSVFDFDEWLKNQKDIQFIRADNNQLERNFFLFGTLILSIVLLGVFFLILTRKGKERNALLQKRNFELDFSKELIRNMIKEDKEIQSVGDLAKKLRISTVHLNRKLQSKNTSALELLKESKKDIAREMYKNGESLANICKRTGYSERFVKSNFLN